MGLVKANIQNCEISYIFCEKNERFRQKLLRFHWIYQIKVLFLRKIIRYIQRMNEIYALTDGAILVQIGEKLKEERVERNLSQKDLATACGLSAFSISQMENGHNTSLLSLIMVLRALNRLEILEELLRERPVSPVAMSEYMRKHPKRKRAYNSKRIEKVTDFEWDKE